MRNKTGKSSWRRVFFLFLGHMLGDGYASFYAPLLPILIDRLDLSLALAGLLGTVRTITNSLLQPTLGHLVDRIHRPLLVAFGPLLTVCAMSLIGRADSFPRLLVIMIVSGIGVAFFHPIAASLVTDGTERKRGLLMAFFSAGGTFGGAAAPLLIVPFVGALGITSTPWLLIPGLSILALFTFYLKRNLPQKVSPSRRSLDLRSIPKRFYLLWTVIALRSVVAVAFSSFMAVLVTERGASAFIGGAAISVFLLTGAIGGFFAGNLSDRFGRRPVMLGTIALSTPFFLLLLYGPPSLLLVTAALAGLMIFSSTPVGVVAAHEILPGKIGLVSGLVMGLAWGVGGAMLTPIGLSSDLFGLLPVMTAVSILPLLIGLLLLFYRDEAHTEVAAN